MGMVRQIASLRAEAMHRRRRGLVAVVLHHVGGALLRLVGVAAGLPQRVALAEQVPVELDLGGPELLAVGLGLGPEVRAQLLAELTARGRRGR